MSLAMNSCRSWEAHNKRWTGSRWLLVAQRLLALQEPRFIALYLSQQSLRLRVTVTDPGVEPLPSASFGNRTVAADVAVPTFLHHGDLPQPVIHRLETHVVENSDSVTLFDQPFAVCITRNGRRGERLISRERFYAHSINSISEHDLDRSLGIRVEWLSSEITANSVETAVEQLRHRGLP